MAITAWADQVNAAGGINGHPVKLIIKDIGANSTGGLQAVQELVQSDHAVAIVGEEDNGDATWASYAESSGVPVVGGLSLDLPFVQNADFFPAGTNAFGLIYGVELLAKQNGPKLGILYCAESPQCANAVALDKGTATVTGIQIPVNIKISATAPDYTAVCEQLKSSGVQSYFVADNSAVVLRVASQCKADGLTAKMVGEDGEVTAAWAGQSSVNGMLLAEAVAPWTDTSIPGVAQYQQAISKYAPSIGNAQGPNAFYGYVAGKLFEAAVAALPAGTAITPQTVKQGLYSLKGETLGGLTPPLTYTQGKPTQVNCYFTMGFESGQFTSPAGTKTTCAPDAFVSGIVASLPKQ
jgi:branched-chain amino acid transport system substrate-binding protein